MISSRQNPKIQQVRTLLGRARERQQAGLFVVEGVRLAEEAAQSGWKAHMLLYTDGLSARGQQALQRLAQPGVEVEEVTSAVMESLADTETSQGLLAVFPRPAANPPSDPDFVLLADNIRDPGNLGTLLRTAAAAGVDAFLAPPGTVDPFSPKVVRSAMGAHFRLPVLEMSWEAAHEFIKHGGLKVYLAEAAVGEVCWEANLREPLALVVGSEAEGVSDEARGLGGRALHIPMPGKSESLNAAVAGAILLFEVVRQRGKEN